MNEVRKPYRVNGNEVVIDADNANYDGTGAGGGNNVKSALDNIKGRVAALEQSGGGGGGGSDTTTSLKILTIGNSFCQNLFFYFQYGLLTNLGITGVTIYNLFKGSMTPASWWDYYNRDDTSFNVEHYAGDAISGLDTGMTVSAVLQAVEWDVVILQQFHTGTPSYSTLLPNLAHLVAHIRLDCPNKKVRIGMNMEWPRSIDYTGTNGGPKGILGYEAIVEEIKAAYNDGNLDFVVPIGTAVMNAAYNSTLNTLMPSGSSYATDKAAEEGGTSHNANPLLLKQYNSDKLHLANGVGKYVIAGCFIETVLRPWCGKSIIESTYTVSATQEDSGSIAVTAENRGLCHAAALYAVANPFTRRELNSKNF